MKRKLEEEIEEEDLETPSKVEKLDDDNDDDEEEEGDESKEEDKEKVDNDDEEEDENKNSNVDKEEKEPVVKIVIDENSPLEDLLQSYGATLSSEDRKIFTILQSHHKKDLEMMPLFGPKRKDKLAKTVSNPLFAHSARANNILQSIKDSIAFTTAMQYNETMMDAPRPEGYYNLEFLLPILCHALDEKNICDVIKVVDHGWVYFIMRGLSMEHEVLRKCAFLAFKRLLFNLQQVKVARNHNVKIWLHFLLSVKRGILQLGECKLSHLISTWLVASWEVLRQPSHPMYNRLTTFLLARPILEMTIVPEFIPFYNASDGNKESREWILNVLYWGLKTNEDWKIAQKLPTIKFLCSSFLLEKVQTRKNIVGILYRGALLPEVAQAMIHKYSLHLWIANITTNDSLLKTHVTKLFQTLKTNGIQSSSEDKIFDFVSHKIRKSSNKSENLALNLDTADDTAEKENVGTA